MMERMRILKSFCGMFVVALWIGTAHAQLLLIEALLPTESAPNWPTTLDIVMLTIGGRQRTLREYSDLLRDSGFQMTREIDTQSGISIVEATAV